MQWNYNAYGNMPGDFTLLRWGMPWLSCHLIVNKIFILPDRYRKRFLCVQLAFSNFQAGESIFPYYFLQVSVSHT